MKIGIVGTGFVGATAAYALVMRGVGREIVLVDKNAKRAEAEADDIAPRRPLRAPAGSLRGRLQCAGGLPVVVMAAGVNQKPGETRMELLSRNASRLPRGDPADHHARAGQPDRGGDQSGRRDDAPDRPDRGGVWLDARARVWLRHDARHRALSDAVSAGGRHGRAAHPRLRARRAWRLGGAGVVDGGRRRHSFGRFPQRTAHQFSDKPCATRSIIRYGARLTISSAAKARLITALAARWRGSST